MRLRYRWAWVCLIIFGFGCSQPETPSGQPVSFSDQAGNPALGGELEFTLPDGWIEEAPTSSMRKAQFRLPGTDGQDAELAIFAGIGGSAQQNVERWIGQFSSADGSPVKDQAKITNRQVNGLKITQVDVSGVFNSGGMGPMGGSGEPKSNYRMLAAVVESPIGPWYLKLTGPEPTVSQWEDSFNQYLDSVQLK